MKPISFGFGDILLVDVCVCVCEHYTAPSTRAVRCMHIISTACIYDTNVCKPDHIVPCKWNTMASFTTTVDCSCYSFCINFVRCIVPNEHYPFMILTESIYHELEVGVEHALYTVYGCCRFFILFGSIFFELKLKTGNKLPSATNSVCIRLVMACNLNVK